VAQHRTRITRWLLAASCAAADCDRLLPRVERDSGWLCLHEVRVGRIDTRELRAGRSESVFGAHRAEWNLVPASAANP
jgi:hypothetical protein